MSSFVRVDTDGFIYGFSSAEPASMDGWAEVDFDPREAVQGPTRYRLVDGEMVDTGLSKFPPNPWMRWDPSVPGWVDPRNLDTLKTDKWAEIKAARDASEHGGFTWDGSLFDSDLESQNKIIGATQLANMSPASFLMDWTLKDNTTRTLTGQQMVSVGQALAIHVNAQHVLGRALRQQIDAATTPAEVAAISWPDDTP